jgi:dihydroorotate dehydrogenase electron transfer subunit
MKKYELDLRVKENISLNSNYFLLKLTTGEWLPEMQPGQFVEVRIDDSPGAFLRRPISINFVDKDTNELWLLIQSVGEGTRRMAMYRVGETVNLLMPLGNGFFIPRKIDGKRLLLIGGGVGAAPLLYLGDVLKQKGFEPEFLLGARTENDLVLLSDFRQRGTVYLTTEDGSSGEKGLVTDHSVLRSETFSRIYTCGPKPMMVAIARYASSRNIPCEASLENRMACGIAACLCCVEMTKEGHKCVCTDGPVFDINDLTWLS